MPKKQNKHIIFDMNTGKATWLKHPKHVITTLHSYSYEGKDELCVMFTLGEEGKIKLLIKNEGDVTSNFLFLHTPNDYILFSKSGIKGKLFTLELSIEKNIGNTIVLEKSGQRLKFIDVENDNDLITISNQAFQGSASFGALSSGKGKTYIEVF